MHWPRTARRARWPRKTGSSPQTSISARCSKATRCCAGSSRAWTSCSRFRSASKTSCSSEHDFPRDAHAMKIPTTERLQIVEPETFGAVYHQRFAVHYDYPVHFTHGLFARDNPVFVEALSRQEPNKRHRAWVLIDADVAASWPGLAHDICAYVEHHGTRLQLVAHPETIVGGEKVKNDPELVSRL